MMGFRLCLSAGRFFLLALLLLSSAVSAQSTVKPPNYFYLSTYGTTVTLGGDLRFDRACVYGDRVVLENACLGSLWGTRSVAVSPRSPSGLDLRITRLDSGMMEFTLTAPAGISETWITADKPFRIMRNRVIIPEMFLPADYSVSSSSCWFYDGENIRLKIQHGSPEEVQIEWTEGAPDAGGPQQEEKGGAGSLIISPVLPAPSLSSSLWVGAGGQERCQFVLGEVVTVRVTVADAYGNPVEGATVAVQVSLPGAPPLSVQMVPAGGGVYGGTFSTSQLGEGTFLLSASVSAPGYEAPPPLTAYLTVSKPSPPPARVPVGALVFLALLGSVLLLFKLLRTS